MKRRQGQRETESARKCEIDQVPNKRYMERWNVGERERDRERDREREREREREKEREGERERERGRERGGERQTDTLF